MGGFVGIGFGSVGEVGGDWEGAVVGGEGNGFLRG